MKNIYNESSRYYEQETVSSNLKSGRTVTALKLRIITKTKGEPFSVKDPTRLDIIAEQLYKNASKFWYIADANTELDSDQLIIKKKNQQKVIEVPQE